ncbi:MAG TPA: hypothetical protein VKG44_05540 [Candidatus Baltobacteraceae bacterium]|nr:hypothetical protein [Candidatus Baltobacteraceae bacterium]
MSALTFLGPWSGFFVMTATSAAGLTGLMFVVITLVTGTERLARSRDGIAIFSTPTVTHLGAALLVSAFFCVPWQSLVPIADLTALVGTVGVFYMLRITFRARRLRNYRPDVEDWFWYAMLPFVAYATLVFGAVVLPIVPQHALFGVAGAVLLLIFIGIHNAWDVVTFLAVDDSFGSSSTNGTGSADAGDESSTRESRP